jgi:hypothetical protein
MSYIFNAGLVVTAMLIWFFRGSFAELALIANTFAAEYNSVYLFDDDVKAD